MLQLFHWHNFSITSLTVFKASVSIKQQQNCVAATNCKIVFLKHFPLLPSWDDKTKFCNLRINFFIYCRLFFFFADLSEVAVNHLKKARSEIWPKRRERRNNTKLPRWEQKSAINKKIISQIKKPHLKMIPIKDKILQLQNYRMDSSFCNFFIDSI